MAMGIGIPLLCARGGRRVEVKGDRAEALPGGASEGNEGESEGSGGEEASTRVR